MNKEEDNSLDINHKTQEDVFKDSNLPNNYNEADKIEINDSNEGITNVVNTPVPISSSTEQDFNQEEISNSPQIIAKIKIFLGPLVNKFLQIGQFFQNLLSKLSEKVQVQQSYKYFIIFLLLGLLLLFFALLCIPFVLFNPGKLLRLLSFGNIFIMLCFLFYYGSKDFFAFLIDQKRTGIMFSHLLGLFFSLFVSIFIGGYFLQLLLDIILSITTVMFILTLVPGGQEGIAGIKRMLISPLLLLFSTLKGKIFADNNNNISL